MVSRKMRRATHIALDTNTIDPFNSEKRLWEGKDPPANYLLYKELLLGTIELAFCKL